MLFTCPNGEVAQAAEPVPAEPRRSKAPWEAAH
jgi:hypothetical protein